MGDIEKPKGTYKFCVKSAHIDTLKPELRKWIDKIVTVSQWREITENHFMRDLFPNDIWMGFVEEFSCDVPESELAWFPTTVLPCPFCGASPRVTWLPVNGDIKERIFGMVICHPCDIMKTAEANKGEGQLAELNAVAAWNNRRAEKAVFLQGYDRGSKDLLESLPKERPGWDDLLAACKAALSLKSDNLYAGNAQVEEQLRLAIKIAERK